MSLGTSCGPVRTKRCVPSGNVAFAGTWRVFLPDHKGARESDVVVRSAMTNDTKNRLPYVLRWLAMTAAIVVIIYLFH